MELELCIDPDDAPRLLRLPMLAGATRGAARSQRIVWHDSADAALTAAGLALAQEQGTWRLEKLVPASNEVWPPGAPAPVVAQAASAAELGHELPAPLAPVVAFVGRRRPLALITEQGAVTLTLVRGTFRAVTAEHAVARLHVSGEERAVLAAALALADALSAAVPRASLPGEALAAARAAAPPARRSGPATLPDGLGIADAFAFAAGHFADVMLHLAPDAAADITGPEPVHQMRVALRRLRSAIAVFRKVLDCPELHNATADLKALGKRLGPARDWDVFLTETLPAVAAAFPRDKALARLANAAARRRDGYQAALRDYLRGADFRRLGIELAWLAGATCWYLAPPPETEEPASLPQFAAGVLDRRLRKLQAEDDLAALDPAALHALRLRAKRVRYAAEIFAPLYPGKAPRRFIHRLAAVQNRLGTLNDRTVAATLLAELGGPGSRHAYAVGLVLGFAAASTTDLLPNVKRRWAKLQRASKFWEG